MKFFTLFLTLFVTALLSTSASASQSTEGTWVTLGGSRMVAHISNHAIQIDWIHDGTRALYWKGDWPSAKPKRRMRSYGDLEAMEYALFASTARSKLFRYSRGTLSFQYSIVGVSRTIYMRKKFA